MKNETKVTPEDSSKKGAARGLLDTIVMWLHIFMLIIGAPVFSVLIGLMEARDYGKLAVRDFTIGFLSYFVNLYTEIKKVVSITVHI